MQINEEYKEIQCIDKLEDQYKERFFVIVKHYAMKLPEELRVEGSAYTLHDFNHHCINIYRIISEIILFPQIAYGREGLTQKELFILDLAVLFHDIGMSSYFDSDRKVHSRKSAEYIQQIYHTPDSVFRVQSDLNENEVKALKLIVMAHSDIKDGSIAENENGLNNPSLKDDIMAQARGRIRARFLASILRLADELDITVERLGNGDTESKLIQLKEKKMIIERELLNNSDACILQKNKEELNKINGYVESLEHWERLHLFSSVCRVDEDSDEVCINLNDEYIMQRCGFGDTYDNLLDEILSVYKKIYVEFENGLISEVNNSKSKLIMKKMISVAGFKIISNIDAINELINKKLKILNTSNEQSAKKMSIVGGVQQRSLEENQGGMVYPRVIDESFQKKLSNIIKRKHLIKVGHFLLDETFCARDWLDTKEIIETGTILEEMVDNILKHINTNFKEENNYLLLGLDFEGAVLASRVGMALQKPFTYLIPAKEIENNSKKEIETLTEKYHRNCLSRPMNKNPVFSRVLEVVGSGKKR